MTSYAMTGTEAELAKLRLFIPLAFLAGFSLWGAFRGLDTIRTRSYDFSYSAGPRGNTTFTRAIHYDGAEAVRVGSGMTALSLCGILWLVAICWPSPPRTLLVHHGLARSAIILYVFSILVLLPPWRLASLPLLAFYSVHGVLFGLWKVFLRVRTSDRKKQFVAVAVLALMLAIPLLETVAGKFGGADLGNDTGFAALVALVSATLGAGQLALVNQRAPWGI